MPGRNIGSSVGSNVKGSVNGKGTDGEVRRDRERRDNRLNLRITESEMNQLNMASYEDDEPVSQLVRKAIKMYLNARRAKF